MADTPPRRRLAKLPSSVWSALGPVPVTVTKGLADADNALGMYHYTTRRIDVDGDQPLHAQYHTLFHEIVHLALSDAGAAHGLTADQEEAICDAVSTWLAGAMMAKTLTLKNST